MHERHPTVQHISVHLDNGQRIYFIDQNARDRVEQTKNILLTAFFQLCKTDTFKSLLYHEVPKYYTWNEKEKKFERRKRGLFDIYTSDALGDWDVYVILCIHCSCQQRLLLFKNVAAHSEGSNIIS